MLYLVLNSDSDIPMYIFGSLFRVDIPWLGELYFIWHLHSLSTNEILLK